MKTIFTKLTYLFVIVSTLFISCDDGFEEENTNPDASNQVDPEYMFTKAIYDALNNSTGTVYEFGAGGFVQHFATYLEVPGLGDKYLYISGSYPYAFFNGAYLDAINEIDKIIYATKGVEGLSNQNAIAQIWKVYTYHRLTDLYGMVPYTEATTAFSEANYSPVYDTQEAIYMDMLNTLQSASGSLDANQPSFGNGDLIYNGNVDQWSRFANSLMLRLAMRLTKVNPTLAEEWAQKAILAGIIAEPSNNAIIDYPGGQVINSNPIAFQLRNNNYSESNQGSSNTEGGKFADTFISYLKENNDPRLSSFAAVWVNGSQKTDPELQQGMPNGLVNRPENFPGLSEPNLNTLLSLNSSLMVLGSAEMNLLLAEASARGWTSGDAQSYYLEGIRDAMNSLEGLYGNEAAVSEEEVNTYIASQSLTGSLEEQMETIHTQFWVSVFPDEIEVYSNWRRTGYPELTPVNVTGNLTGGTIPRRLTYPPSEISVNTENYEAAVSQQGLDLFTTRVWWDVEQ